jgi:lipopolysaccharide biosynthesis glycosyltransferase
LVLGTRGWPGIKADAQRAKDTGETYNPNGAGAAWSHNFLNQKPWHPLNFRNQKMRFEAEEKAFKDAKANQIAQVWPQLVALFPYYFPTSSDSQRTSELPLPILKFERNHGCV